MGVVWALWVEEVVLLVRILVIGSEVMMRGARAAVLLAGRGGSLDEVPVAIDQETGPAKMCCEAQRAVQLLSEQGLRGGRLVSKVRAVLLTEN